MTTIKTIRKKRSHVDVGKANARRHKITVSKLDHIIICFLTDLFTSLPQLHVLDRQLIKGTLPCKDKATAWHCFRMAPQLKMLYKCPNTIL